jgi:hypothetical protein
MDYHHHNGDRKAWNQLRVRLKVALVNSWNTGDSCELSFPLLAYDHHLARFESGNGIVIAWLHLTCHRKTHVGQDSSALHWKHLRIHSEECLFRKMSHMICDFVLVAEVFCLAERRE